MGSIQPNNEPEPESLANEEQRIKYGEIIELLVAAGYFRARISSLSPFDRVIGGMAWCLTNSAVDVDVDVVFIENSTIGQKITLSEKIIRALPRLKCPLPLEPHQIQGLNFKEIFPVMQWLVKKVLETREEMSDYIRNFSESQFSKTRSTPRDDEFLAHVQDASVFLGSVKDRYKPTRQFRSNHDRPHLRFARLSPTETSSMVDNTLLEYGQRWMGSGAADSSKKSKDKSEKDEKAAAEAAEERRRIEALIEQMSRVEGGAVSQDMLGSMLGLESESIKQYASEYAEVQAALAESQQKMGGAQAHNREVISLEKQIAMTEKRYAEVKESHEKLLAELNEYQGAVAKTIKYNNRIVKETAKLDELETPENAPILRQLRALLATTDSLEQNEKDFKLACKKQMEDLKAKILKMQAEGQDEDEDTERIRQIEAQYDEDSQKLQRIRKLLSKKKREIAGIERLVDEIPSRTELSQYQKRFLELYSQVASKLSETRQYYSLYNTLDSTKIYLSREVSLLNSIFDNFDKAKASKSNQERFIDSLETMLKGVRDLQVKVEGKRAEEKAMRDKSNEKYLQLVDKQRQYFKTIIDFQEECRRTDLLQMKMSEVVAAQAGTEPATPATPLGDSSFQ